MKTMRLRSWMVCAAGVAVGCCLVSCEGLSVSLTSDGKFVVRGTVPAPKGKVVADGKGGK
jgi:hypothetical protein